MTDLRLAVKTEKHEYPIVIARQGAVFGADLSAYVVGRQVLVVSNETVAPLYLELLLSQLAEHEVAVCVLPDGEMYKTQDSIDNIYDTLMNHHFGRDCTLIALGGGVVGDMTGFAAASFMRGVNFIQVPTTLLAQVDSSVGGKTGINHRLGKNMIGAFWQPSYVLADMQVLATLPAREFAAGMAEVIKYALIMSEPFLTWLEDNHAAINAQNLDVLAEMVFRCCEFKAEVVASDEKETGRRAILNFGHTFGHAIETYMGYGNWLHGEAVAVGMVQASQLSQLQGMLSLAEVERIVRILQIFGLPVVPPSIPVDDALSLMGHDKKVKNGKMRFVLLDGIGRAIVTDKIDGQALNGVLTGTF